MVTPQQILALATELAGRDDEAAVRCAISRAYYAAFLHCRAWLADRGQAFARSAREHGNVYDRITAYDRQMGEQLRYLRNRRNNADYDPEITITRDLAQLACATAARIISELDAVPRGTSN